MTTNNQQNDSRYIPGYYKCNCGAKMREVNRAVISGLPGGGAQECIDWYCDECRWGYRQWTSHFPGDS